MKITAADVIVTSPGRNFVTLKITTDEGLTGLGDATVNGRELAVASYLQDHIVPLLIGRDPARVEDTWQLLYRGAYWRRGPITMTSIAAVDTALWDIKGKIAGLPVYQLLGGRCRDRMLVYGHASGNTVEEAVEEVGRYLDAGYKAVRAQVAVPGVQGAYGVTAGQHYDPADSELPRQTSWSTEAYLPLVPILFQRLREAYGADVHLLHDAHHRLTPIEAARLAKDLEPYRLLWLEDPVRAELQDGYRLIRSHSTTPIATGEVFSSIWDCTTLITEQLIDYIRMSVSHSGGISHLRKIFTLAEQYHVRSGSHGATDLSPVCLAAALHLDAAIPNFGVQEYMPHLEQTNDVFPHSYEFRDGHLYVSEAPGLGVRIDEEAAARYPYVRAYLPTARKLDGTVHDW